MRLFARAISASVVLALLSATAALAQQLPSDADTPSDSPSAWHHVEQHANNPIGVRHDAARGKWTRRREGRQMMSVA